MDVVYKRFRHTKFNRVGAISIDTLDKIFESEFLGNDENINPYVSAGDGEG